jgi:hypothetical protein
MFLCSNISARQACAVELRSVDRQPVELLGFQGLERQPLEPLELHGLERQPLELHSYMGG